MNFGNLLNFLRLAAMEQVKLNNFKHKLKSYNV